LTKIVIRFYACLTASLCFWNQIRCQPVVYCIDRRIENFIWSSNEVLVYSGEGWEYYT